MILVDFKTVEVLALACDIPGVRVWARKGLRERAIYADDAGMMWRKLIQVATAT